FGAAAGAGGGGRRLSAGSMFGGGSGGRGGGGGALGGDTYIITVQGALDPAAVADQIDRLLTRRARRIGAAPAFAR
ncbi:MAG: hypothetical protein ABWY20_20245, partial [Mycobacterium sp.]